MERIVKEDFVNTVGREPDVRAAEECARRAKKKSMAKESREGESQDIVRGRIFCTSHATALITPFWTGHCGNKGWSLFQRQE